MEKGDIFTRNLIYKLSLNKGFNKFIGVSRRRLKIKDGGFLNDGELDKWFLKDMDRTMQVLAFDFEVQKQFGIPLIFSTTINEYLFFGPDKAYIPKDPKIVIEDLWGREAPKNTLGRFYQEIGVPFVNVYMLGGSTQEQIVDEIRRKWGEIESAFAHQGHGIRKARSIDDGNKKRDALVFKLYSKSRKELGCQKGDYKEIKISDILKKDYNIEVNSENIRSIFKEQKKLRFGKFKFQF